MISERMLERLSKVGLWKYVFFFTLSAILISEILVIIQSVVLTGNLFEKDFLIIGFFTSMIDAALICIVSAIVLKSLRGRYDKLEDKSDQVEERFRIAMDAIKDGLWDWNTVTGEVFYSENWKRMLGYSEGEIDFKLSKWSDRVHPDDLEYVMKDVDKHFSGETKLYTSTHRVKHKDGSWIWVLNRGKAMFDKDGKPYRLIGFYTDISNQKKNQEELKRLVTQSTKLALVGEMMGFILHQWKHPLNVLSLAGECIGDAYEDRDDEGIKYIEKQITTQVNNLFLTMESFRSFMDPNKEIEQFRPCAEFQSIIVFFEAKFKIYNIKAEIKKHDCFYCHAVKHEFWQVGLAIMDNCIDQIVLNNVKDGYIAIDFEHVGNICKIIIQDNGGGISPDLLPNKIFEAHVSTKGDNGTGLGLRMCKLIIEDSMQGKIRAENRADGARFEIEVSRSYQ